MSIHKLTAGSGYDYLTRQVAALDATEKGHVPLASYYSERNPGCGSVRAGRDRRFEDRDPVTAEQMQALFGVGLHPSRRSDSSSSRSRFAGPRLPTCHPAGRAA